MSSKAVMEPSAAPLRPMVASASAVQNQAAVLDHVVLQPPSHAPAARMVVSSEEALNAAMRNFRQPAQHWPLCPKVAVGAAASVATA